MQACLSGMHLSQTPLRSTSLTPQTLCHSHTWYMYGLRLPAKRAIMIGAVVLLGRELPTFGRPIPLGGGLNANESGVQLRLGNIVYYCKAVAHKAPGCAIWGLVSYR